MPFVLIAAALFVMALHIVGRTVHHRLAWEPTVVTVISSEPVQTLRANGTRKADLEVALVYEAGGTRREWSGHGTDIGVYTASAGETIRMVFDPADPSRLDTAAMKGWRGAVLLFATTGSFVAFYVWFFWLRQRGGRKPPSQDTAPPTLNMPLRRGAELRRTTFGNR